MIAEIAGGLAALKSASELTKAIMDLRDATVVQAKAIELQRQILAAQESALAANERQTTLLEQIKALEKEIARLKKWNADKSKYEMKSVGSGAFAYLPSPSDDPRAANHWLCVTCFDTANEVSCSIKEEPKTGINLFSGALFARIRFMFIGTPILERSNQSLSCHNQIETLPSASGFR